jgi:hypothetical protein
MNRQTLSRPARFGLIAAVSGAVLLVLGLLLAVFGAVQTMPSYLAGWLFLAAIPFGALPLVLALDLVGPVAVSPASALVAAALRRQLLLAPLAAVLAIPLLFRVPELFLHGTLHTPLDRFWMAVPFYVPRVIVVLILWTLLALSFAGRRAVRHKGWAAAGLALHFVLGTIAATDFAMAVEPGWTSADFGVLFMASQCVIALSCAILFSLLPASQDRRRLARQTEPGAAKLDALGLVLLGLTGLWMFLQYTQFETIWSADLPAEIIWYIHRDAGGGHAAAWIGVIGGFVLPVLMLPWRRADAVRLVAGLLLAVQMLDMLWLITPAYRALFTITFIDVIEMAGMAGIGFGGFFLLGLLKGPEAELRSFPAVTEVSGRHGAERSAGVS